jgi:Icc-related predicted phosphoesterase
MMNEMEISIIAISDTHGFFEAIDVPAGDILVHAGDLTHHGEIAEVERFNDFLRTLPHPTKIVIAGNHDFCFERDPEACAAILTNAIYLQDQAVTVEGIRFYGSPWQPWFYDWAFNLQRGPEIRAKWELIPIDTDVLITHGPPFNQGDRTIRGERVGCQDLLEVVDRIKPKVHIFGHIHEGYGLTHNENTTFINASICDASYRTRNAPIAYTVHF